MEYRRRCPSCQEMWRSCEPALKCWYSHDPKWLEAMTIREIADHFGVNNSTIVRAWKNIGAKPRHWIQKPGTAYNEVVRYAKGRRQTKKVPERGWTVRLAKQLGISRQRISQLYERAQDLGHI